MTVSVRIKVEADILDAYSELATVAPRLVADVMRIEWGRIAEQVKAELTKEPPRPHYPIKWKSEKQRRYVMMLLKATAHLPQPARLEAMLAGYIDPVALRQNKFRPYDRSGTLTASWEVKAETTPKSGGIQMANYAPYAVFVQGVWQQPFHAETPWVSEDQIITKYQPIAENVLIDQWYIINEVLIPKGAT